MNLHFRKKSERFDELFIEKLGLKRGQFNNLDYIKNTIWHEDLLRVIDESYTSNSSFYRQKYEFLTGLLVPKGFEIHHIDLNRNNNHIKNLVALPNKVHKKFHAILSLVNSFIKKIEFDPILYDTGGCDIPEYQTKELFDEFIKHKQDASFWVGYRNTLLGINLYWPVKNYKKIKI